MARDRRSHSKTQRLSVYSNLSARRQAKKDARHRKKAEYLSTLPKNPALRMLYRLSPKRVARYWFSRQGLVMGFKILGVFILFMILAVGAVFAYYRQELDQIKPSELAKRVTTTVTKYTDRNGILLWEDKGSGDYRLVVSSGDISNYMKEATVAVEDKDFYKHGGISFSGIARAVYNNFSGGSTQGGSTLTQQLVKQVFFPSEESDRGLSGIPRKLKEAILAVEVERTYDKDQILTLYLNESPYGGQRNGVESAAQTYFGVDAKDLTLPQAALLAALPQNPSEYDPYNIPGHEALLARQHDVLDDMVKQGNITQKQADDAKKVAILDTLKPESDQFQNIQAPHFVEMVRSQLETQLGKAVMGQGGLTIQTTLDLRVQNVVQAAITKLFQTSLPRTANFDNASATVVDNQTGQILALQGSRDYNYPGYGQTNEATAFIQPGSSIKPFVYASLFKQKPAGQANWGAGSILQDEPIDNIYGAHLVDFENNFVGPMTIRNALAQSRNIPAVEAMYIAGEQPTLQTIHDMGDLSYCTQGVDKQVGLASAIGGCGLKQTEHANSFATIARGGIYTPVASVLKVTNSQGQVLQQWKAQPKQVIDPQISWLLESILSDDNARAPTFGHGAPGLNVPGVKTFTKTGTANIGSKSSNIWINSVSPKATVSLWAGNHDDSPMGQDISIALGPTVDNMVGPIHTQIFEKDGTWHPGEWFTQPAGIQTLSVGGHTDIFPSWYNKSQAESTSQMTFDSVSKKLATSCTPAAAKITQTVTTSLDPVTKKTTIIAPNGYDASSNDDVHNCSDVPPFIGSGTNDITITPLGSGSQYTITANVTQGTHPLQSVQITVDGNVISQQNASATGPYSATTALTAGAHTIVVQVTDSALYSGTLTKTVSISGP